MGCRALQEANAESPKKVMLLEMNKHQTKRGIEKRKKCAGGRNRGFTERLKINGVSESPVVKREEAGWGEEARPWGKKAQKRKEKRKKGKGQFPLKNRVGGLATIPELKAESPY